LTLEIDKAIAGATMEHRFISQGHAEDVINRHRYCYYVEGKPLVPDSAYDSLERRVRELWSVSVCDTVGSDQRGDYARYIQEGRRPLDYEREERDKAIAQRWMESL